MGARTSWCSIKMFLESVYRIWVKYHRNRRYKKHSFLCFDPYIRFYQTDFAYLCTLSPYIGDKLSEEKIIENWSSYSEIPHTQSDRRVFFFCVFGPFEHCPAKLHLRLEFWHVAEDLSVSSYGSNYQMFGAVIYQISITDEMSCRIQHCELKKYLHTIGNSTGPIKRDMSSISFANVQCLTP